MCCLTRMTKNIYCHYSLKSLFFFPQCHYHNFIPRFWSHFKQNKHSIISCKMYLVVILKQFRNLVDMIWMDELIHELCFLCVLRTTDPIRFAHIYRASKGSYCYKHWILIIMSWSLKLNEKSLMMQYIAGLNINAHFL